LDLARARAASSAGDHHTASALRAKAGALLSQQNGFQQSDVRMAKRLLARAMQGTLVCQPPAPWRVHADGAWFSAPHRPRVELGRRRPLRRLLVALAKGRLERPGSPLTAGELVEAAWPAERILPEAALNRLRVALHSLRRLGLAESLVTHADGYFLDPAIPLELGQP